MIETFATDRLLAERIRADHFAELGRMHRDPRVMATLSGVRTEEQTRDFLRESLEHWDRHGYGLWIFRDRAGGGYAGRGGIRRVHVDGRDEVELAYALMAECWGRGLASEMARAILGLAFGHYGLDDLACFTMTTNLKSRRVMEKAGFAYEKDITHHGLPHAFYRLKADAWRGRTAV